MQTSARNTVPCDRCQGQMLREHIYRRGAWWWRCVSCGERVDGVILRHRAEQAADAAFLRDSQDIELRQWAEWLAKIPGGDAITVLRVGEVGP